MNLATWLSAVTRVSLSNSQIYSEIINVCHAETQVQSPVTGDGWASKSTALYTGNHFISALYSRGSNARGASERALQLPRIGPSGSKVVIVVGLRHDSTEHGARGQTAARPLLSLYLHRIDRSTDTWAYHSGRSTFIPDATRETWRWCATGGSELAG